VAGPTLAIGHDEAATPEQLAPADDARDDLTITVR
jgi:hypothetical protein